MSLFRKLKWGSAPILLLILLGCGKKDFEHASFRVPPKTEESLSRVNVIRIYSEGALEQYFTSIDMGVKRSEQNGEVDCRFLVPENPTVASRSASPAHLYSNKTQEEFEKGEGNTDAEEVYFPGDNDNRNGRNDSHQWTRIPSREYFEFRDVLQVSPSEYRFFVHFDLGGYQFSGNVQVRTWTSEGACETGAFLCTDIDADGSCIAGDWPHRIESLTVHISKWRYPWGNYVRKIMATPFDSGESFQIGGG